MQRKTGHNNYGTINKLLVITSYQARFCVQIQLSLSTHVICQGKIRGKIRSFSLQPNKSNWRCQKKKGPIGTVSKGKVKIRRDRG